MNHKKETGAWLSSKQEKRGETPKERKRKEKAPILFFLFIFDG